MFLASLLARAGVVETAEFAALLFTFAATVEETDPGEGRLLALGRLASRRPRRTDLDSESGCRACSVPQLRCSYGSAPSGRLWRRQPLDGASRHALRAGSLQPHMGVSTSRHPATRLRRGRGRKVLQRRYAAKLIE